MKRIENEKKNHGKPNWDKILNNKNLNTEDKETIMILEAERLQNLAERKERLLKV